MGPGAARRHQLVGISDSLTEFYDEWERWAPTWTRPHSYIIIVSFRSPPDALLGGRAPGRARSAALYLSLSPSAAPSEARLCLRMGFTCLRSIATVFHIPFDRDPRPDAALQLTYDEFRNGVARLEQSGFPLEVSPEEAWPNFRGWRVNYESLAYALAEQTNAVPAPWSGPRRNIVDTVEFQRPTDRTPGEPEGRGVRR